MAGYQIAILRDIARTPENLPRFCFRKPRSCRRNQTWGGFVGRFRPVSAPSLDAVFAPN